MVDDDNRQMFCPFVPGVRHNAYPDARAMRGTAGDDNIWLVGDGDKCSVHLHQVLDTMHVQEQCGELLETTTCGLMWMGNKCSVHLHQVLGTMLTRVQEQCGELVQTTMAPQSGLQTFDFLGNSILAAVDQQVASSLPGTLPMPAA